MKRQLIPAWLIQFSWFVAGIFATGAVWFFLSQNNLAATAVSVCGAAALTLISIFLQRAADKDRRFAHLRNGLGSLLNQGNQLQAQGLELQDNELAIWQKTVEKYITENLDQSYIARFYDFTGIPFYSDGSEGSKLRNALKGNVHRLHDFLREFRE